MKVISEHKSKLVKKPVKPGYRRVEALVKENDCWVTKHLDIPREA